MEPDKTYQLHSDDTSQPSALPAPSVGQNEAQPVVPSKYNQSTATSSPSNSEVPWYLRPLTKTTQSPLTSTQTRPFVPRQPLPPSQQSYQPPQPVPSPNPEPVQKQQERPQSPPPIQAPPVSPFRSQPVMPSTSQGPWKRSSIPLSSPERFQMPRQPQQPVYQQPAAGAVPTPFSQFGTSPQPQPQLQARPTYAAPAKPKRSRKLIGIALAVLLVAGIGAGGYALWRNSNNQPAAPAVVANAEEKLYQAIENHLATGKVRQEYQQTITSAETSTVRLDTTSDFSDPRSPKSHIKYEIMSGKGDSAIDGGGELIVRDANEYYAKLAKPALFYEGDEAAKPKVDQWYVIPANDAAGELLMDPLAARTSINSPLGEFPVGGFSDGTRQELMQFIKGQNVYKVISADEVELDGKKMTHYVIGFNAELVNELNKKVFAAIGGNPDKTPVSFVETDTRKTEVWVSDDTTKIARVKIDHESRSGEGSQAVKETTLVNVTYPTDLSILDKPDNAIAGPWRKTQ